MSLDFNRDARWNRNFEISRMAHEPIFPRRAGISLVRDSAAPRVHLKRQSADVADVNVAAYRADVHMTIANVGQANLAAESLHMEMGIADIGHFNGSSHSFEDYIATQSLHLKLPV